ncbi:AAA family ATPase [Thiolapillus sp.]|uniref:AAA family ATPase n=2 Tax=Thiolapillus sp. TaxID=2017437 RepID=UPI003AF5D78C
MPQPSWSPSTMQQLRKLVAAPYLSPNDWTPRLDAYFASPLAQGTPGKQCSLAATGDYQPSLRSPWLAAEEPENYLHPRLLPELAEECDMASECTQLLVTTHSPFFIDRLKPEQVRVLYRADDGYTRVKRVADMLGIREFLEEGASLGDMWMEGHFEVGDPFSQDGSK